MKPVKTTSEFRLHYKARIAKDETLQQAFRESLHAFLNDRTLVDDHPLERQMVLFRSFSINEDYRVVYLETPEYFLLIDVGTHEEVYER